MSNHTIQIIIATYPTPEAAESGLKKLELARADQGVEIRDAAVVRRAADGKLHIRETSDVTGGHGAAVGGILGGVLGILAGPAGVVVGAALGAAVGGVAASAVNTGIPHKRLTAIGGTLKAGGAALVVLCESGYAAFIQTVIGGDGVEIHTESMNPAAAEQLGHDHDVAVKALTLGEALADGGEVEIPSKDEG